MPDATLTQPSNAAPPAPPAGKPRKPASKKQGRTVVIASVTAAALAVGGYFLYRFLTKNDSAGAEMQTVVADYGSIQSKASGSGNAKAKENAAITLSAGGTVREVFVAAGDTVTAGQPLYTIYSQSAQDEVSTAQEQLDGLNKDMNALLEDANNLTVRAPFAGKLLNVKDFDPDQDITKGETVATLVNDKKLKLSLYFSYAHEGQIHTGQSVNVSIPSVMANLTGTVEKIHKVSYISPEGAVHFEAVIVFDNPGTLTAGMEASASLTASDGTAIYPYQNGKTEYYETREIVTKAAGPLVSKGNLHDYANVSAGEALLTMGSDTIDLDIRSKQKELDDAQTKLDDAQKALANFNAVSPIDGTVTSMNLQVGQEVKSGDTAVMISNNTTMLVDITVDDRNISFINQGMTVELTDYNQNVFMGTVTSINMGGAESKNGMTTYPVTLEVDNSAGSLYDGAWLDYSFVTSEVDNCIIVPSQAVIYVSDTEGNPYTVVFVQAEEKPENAIDIDIPEVMEGETPQYPSPKDGFYPIPVTTGLSDNYNVEVKEGLQGGETVFQAYIVDQAWG